MAHFGSNFWTRSDQRPSKTGSEVPKRRSTGTKASEERCLKMDSSFMCFWTDLGSVFGDHFGIESSPTNCLNIGRKMDPEKSGPGRLPSAGSKSWEGTCPLKAGSGGCRIKLRYENNQ